MKENDEFPRVDEDISSNAVRIFDNSSDEFPILKAFQKYIDAEQSKARKRMLTLSVFFGVLLTVVIVMFLALLYHVSGQNQQLNDRMIECVLRENERHAAPVVVQPPVDNSHLLEKINALQQKLEESTRKAAEEAARIQAEREASAKAEAERKAAEMEAAKGPTSQEMEIARLKALLSAERKAADEERARRHEQEIEAYRRRHYPEYYQGKREEKRQKEPASSRFEANDSEIYQIIHDLDVDEPIDYFKEDYSPKSTYSIPVEINGSSKSWRIPE